MSKSIIIYPFWNGDTWVFDDPRLDLMEEQFVEGVPAMLDEMLKRASINRDDVLDGFRLKMSDSDFDKRQAIWEWQAIDEGGNWYVWEEAGLRGWLCAQLQRYFGRAPKRLYLQVVNTLRKGEKA